MGPIGAPPDLDVTHLSDRRDRRGPGGLGAPQRELLKQAVQRNGRHLCKLDPAMCPEAEWRLDWDEDDVGFLPEVFFPVKNMWIFWKRIDFFRKSHGFFSCKLL